ncbi:hypothetical protein FHR32_008731 [Streptosporangium album]|uniref:Uncharacterized protein n=1 Tax=Streptosporangium album TaxID=47479 RepID=A0A7W7WF43_9ACTN|nr:hypothetical protein [Streptosporangium album]MBB4936539.1 hypothetical protein [Streptosporangium album]MBB4936616.1 hypothetical protein [Streptosporangium album]MBB4936620.1 hypothetical protein [Streptosporangium album]MBB4936655.1 hypothetical protein [Streptosporangium album]MBB4936832.1 hypothetical protein [Streptosporangium album]
MSSPLLERITMRLVALGTHADRLREQLAETEDEMDRLRVAEQVVKELLADDPAEQLNAPGEPGGEPTPFYQVMLTPAQAAEQASQGIELRPIPVPVPASVPVPGGLLIPHRHHAAGTDELPADYQALLAAVRAADGPLICKAICAQLSLSTESGQVEGVRAKLNRLAERGWLRKTPSGAFAP